MRILVADDNPESAKTLGWALEIFGHEVRVETSGRKAVEAAAAFLPQIVLLDIGMPDMDGYAACRAMKQLPGLKKTVFIAQTGWSREKDLDLAREAGFAHHLVKPVDIRVLQETVAAAARGIA